jgi:hypothetical protein
MRLGERLRCRVVGEGPAASSQHVRWSPTQRQYRPAGGNPDAWLKASTALDEGDSSTVSLSR